MSLNEKDITIDAYNKSTGNVLKLNPTQLAYLKARLSEKAFKAYYLYYHGEKVSKISEGASVDPIGHRADNRNGSFQRRE